MAAKTLATYLGELSAVASLGAGDKIPVLESSTVKYVEGDDVGGGLAVVSAQTLDFTANGASGTIYITNAGNDFGDIIATLENSAVGTKYVFVTPESGTFIVVVPPLGHTISFWIDGQVSASVATNAVGMYLGTQYGFAEIIKITATAWSAGFVSATLFD